MEYTQRQQTVQTTLAERGIDLAVFGAGPNLQYLTGQTVDWRRFSDLNRPLTTLVVPATGQPVLLTGPFTRSPSNPPCETRSIDLFEDGSAAVEAVLEGIDADPESIAVDPYTDASVVLILNEYYPSAATNSGANLLDELRMIKSDEEVDRLREVASLTDEVMRSVIEDIDVGDTMRDVELAIETVGREHGATDISFPPTAGFCKPGKGKTEEVYNYDPDEGIEPGTSIAFDVGLVHEGYCSDWGRSAFFGDPPADVREAYSVLMTAVTETIDAIGDEVTRTDEVFPYIEQVCEREGYAEYLHNRHPNGIVGHQIGVEVHESPWLHPDSDAPLVDGMVFCIEPKLWNDGKYYLRVEDMVHVRDGSAESLTRYDRDAFIV